MTCRAGATLTLDVPCCCRADMLPGMKKRSLPEIAIVGTGNLGRALAVSLKQSKIPVREIVSRKQKASRRRASILARAVGAQVVILGDPVRAPLVWLCVPDREIESCAKALAKSGWKGRYAFHSSGALGSDVLQSLRERGVTVASVHPLMTFVPGSAPSLIEVPFALEGDRAAVNLARKLVAALGGRSFAIAKENKPLYHAWGTFASPLVTILLEVGERVAHKARIPPRQARLRAARILHQTVENYVNQGAALGFSGPIVRGDAAIVRRHLQVLEPIAEAQAVYRALARAALRMLPVRNREELRRVLR